MLEEHRGAHGLEREIPDLVDDEELWRAVDLQTPFERVPWIVFPRATGRPAGRNPSVSVPPL